MFHDIFKLSASVAGCKFYKWVQVGGIDVYIPHHMHQVKHHSSPWLLATCAAAIVHRNYLFCLCQQSKLQIGRLVITSKVFLKLPIFHMLKKKKRVTSQKPGSQVFSQISNSVCYIAINLLYLSSMEVLPYPSDKAKLLPENFPKNSNFNDSGISLPVFPSRTNLKVHNSSVIPKMVKKVITNLDL